MKKAKVFCLQKHQKLKFLDALRIKKILKFGEILE